MTRTGTPHPGRHGNVEPDAPSIGIDVGGTHARVALIDSCGTVLARCRRPTRELSTFAMMVDWTASVVRDLTADVQVNESGVSAIGLALPGLLNAECSGIRRSVNVPQLDGQPFAPALHKAVGIPVQLITDGDAATWGEYTARTETAVFAHLRIGTGVALGLIVDGAIVDLDDGRTTHSEALIVDRSESAPACVCGLHGCLEAVVSGAALKRSMRALGLEDDARALEKAIQRGDAAADALLTDAARAVSSAFQNIAERWQPTVLVLGGGVIERLPSLFDRVEDALRMTTPHGSHNLPKLARARLGDDAGVIGAARLAHQIAPMARSSESP